MALYQLRTLEPTVVNISDDDNAPHVVKLDPRVTYNSDDPHDKKLLDKRKDLFRELVTPKK